MRWMSFTSSTVLGSLSGVVVSLLMIPCGRIKMRAGVEESGNYRGKERSSCHAKKTQSERDFEPGPRAGEEAAAARARDAADAARAGRTGISQPRPGGAGTPGAAPVAGIRPPRRPA